MNDAYFAGGCFWCITPVFIEAGAERAECGYSGGAEKDPSYSEVKSQLTGHRETVRVVYDPGKVSYDTLLDAFLENVDPFDGGGQFIDRGRSYTLAVYYTSEAEKEAAAGKIGALEKAGGRKTFISVEPFVSFYPAEEEHQDFYLKNPEAFRCELKTSGRKRKLDAGK